jgi:hypothetical protein
MQQVHKLSLRQFLVVLRGEGTHMDPFTIKRSFGNGSPKDRLSKKSN